MWLLSFLCTRLVFFGLGTFSNIGRFPTYRLKGKLKRINSLIDHGLFHKGPKRHELTNFMTKLFLKVFRK